MIRIIFKAVVLLFVTLFPTAIYATNGHQLSAIGAYQQGMGGATTAAPYDASTAITNPAGMAMIGSRTDFSFQAFFPKRAVSFAGGGETTGGSNIYLVPAIGWTAPVNDRQDIFFGGGMYGVSGMGVDFDTISAPFMEAGPGPFSPGTAHAHMYSQYQFWKMAPTIAWKWKSLAIGLALNVNYQAFGFENYFTGDPVGNGIPDKIGMDLSEMQGALGYGGTIGLIYQPAPEFSVGVSYASKQTFSDFKWRLSDGDVSIFDMTSGATITNKDGIYRMNLDFPQQAAFGMGVRLGRPVLWTVDVKWINYSDTYDVAKLRGVFDVSSGGTISEIPLKFGWDDVWVYATGLQIDATPNLAIRAGYNYSTSPIKEEDVESLRGNSYIFPAIVTQRVSGGFTYRFGRHWEMTAAYMKAFKEELTGMFGTEISLEEQAVDLEISYRF